MASQRFEIDGTAFILPEEYLQLNSLPEDPPGSRTFIKETPGSLCYVQVAPLVRAGWMPFDNPRHIIDGIHHALDDDQGLVEAACEVTHSGKPVAYTIVKSHVEPAGVQYCLTMHLKFSTSVVSLQGFFDEAGVTGMREATVFELLRREEALTLPDMEGWAQDPYDPTFELGFLMNQAEKPEYDKGFPLHPLSEARRLVAFVLENN